MNLMSRLTLGLAAAALLLAAACTDPTVAPKSSVTGANFFNDPNSYQVFLAKIYAGLALSGQAGPSGSPDISGIDEGFSQYLRLYWETEELPTDEAIIGWNDIGLPEMNTMTWTSSSAMVVAMYYRIFFQVGMANEFLRQSTAAKLASRGQDNPTLVAQVQQYRAEARFLRALSYWHGLDLFGDIPLVTENDPIGATPPKQSTRAAIYAYVVSELNAIRDSLPASGAATYGRATKPAADMLLAELYINDSAYTGTTNWTGAMSSIQNVLSAGYQLDTSYRHLFQADNNTSPEIIFAIPFDGVRTETWGGTTFLVHASCGGNMNKSSYGIDGCWWGLRLKPQAYAFYAAGDKRAGFFWGPTQDTAQHVAVTNIGNFFDGVAAPKFTNKKQDGSSGSNPTFPDTDFPVFRLGEAYLIYAEAFLRGGGGTQAQAVTYFNALRERAYGNTTADITGTQLTLDTLLAERGRELLWEAHRRTDLVRFGEFTGNKYVWAWKGNVLAGQATDAHFNLYPLPASELIANPNLKQNPGY
jgi:starch-binding outer membrane protein, SusD/RagB family